MATKQKQSILVLPSGRSGESFVTTLAHPRTSKPTRYLVDPAQGIYEFTLVSPSKGSFRSWLLMNNTSKSTSTEKSGPASITALEENSNMPKDSASQASIISQPALLVATPIDPLFLILPTLFSLAGDGSKPNGLFLSADDVLEHAQERSPHFENVFRHGLVKSKLENTLSAVCDSVEAGDETMYRLKEQKLLDELLAKVNAVRKSNLPVSMEDKFIKGALDLPVSCVAREETMASDQLSDQNDTTSETATPLESQSSIASSDASSFAESTATGVTTPDTVDASPLTIEPKPDSELMDLLRLRTLLKYMLASYIPAPLAAKLQQLLDSDQSPIDFKPLDIRIALVSKIRAEVQAARSASDFSRKRNAYEDDEMAEERAEKKRKKEDEEKRKKQESRGIKNLKKADTSGMKKLSSFFGKKVATKS